jgi:hypothetical protein
MRSVISARSRPCPSGSVPRQARSSGVIPDIMNWVIRPVSSVTPSAAYRAGTASRARSTMRCSNASGVDSMAMESAASQTTTFWSP